MTFGALNNVIRGCHSGREWEELVVAWGWRCFYCAKPVRETMCPTDDSLTRDHLIPLSRGGSNDIGNIVPACLPCNQLKGPMTFDEFREARPVFFTAEQNDWRKSTGRNALGGVPQPFLSQAVHYLAPKMTMNPADDPAYWLRRRETLRNQTIQLSRMRKESAGQLTLPIFGDGAAKKLCETEPATLPFKGMQVTK
jgi:HNH endonuclease